MTAPMNPFSWRPVILAVGVGGLALTHGAPSAAATLQFPYAGVLCDPGASICYDQRGASIALTETYLGAAAAQRLNRSLRGRAPQQQFRLSTGAYCSLSERSCWRDGWGRRQLDPELAGRLFIAEATPSRVNASATREAGLCTLSQRGAVVFNGACGLRQVERNGSTRYVVSLNNGTTYNVSNRSGQFQLLDRNVTWPVAITSQGNTGIFRWRDVQLTATRQADGQPYNGHYNYGQNNYGQNNYGQYNNGLFTPGQTNNGLYSNGPYRNGPYNGGYDNPGVYNGNGLNPGLDGILNLIQTLFR